MRNDNSLSYRPGPCVTLGARQTVRRIASARFELTVRKLIVACRVAALPLLIVLAGIAAARAQQPPNQRTSDLTNLSLDELMKVEVTSVSKREQRLFEAPAAVRVITQEDIRRSGATSIPELLRMVPGLQVAKISSNKWAITSRGSNSEFANKLLVLIDGRSVYTPLFAGVYWDVQDVLLEDIERIEVIRGPGASLWGSNAVNGVINIITKKARDTLGGLITVGTGTQERGFGGIRYGNKIGSHAHYRVYAKYFDRCPSLDETGKDAADGWDVLRGGFRLDWNISQTDSLTVQGDIYRGDIGGRIKQTLAFPPFSESADEQVRTGGGNVLTRWSRVLSPECELSLQFYYDRTHRDELLLGEVRNTWDFDFQHKFAARRNEIVWGMGLRTTSDDISSSFMIVLDPASRTTSLFNLFVQDEITLVENRLRLTVGSKFERNPYTGFASQPSARLMWMPRKGHAVWAAVSHADRTPSRVERDMRINISVVPPDMSGLMTYLSLFGNRAFESEQLNAYELGYRFQPTPRIFLRVAAFVNDYNKLSRTLVGTPFFERTPQPPHLVIPLLPDNGGESKTRGIEASVDWAVAKRWRLAGAYSWFEQTRASQAQSGAKESIPDESPRNQFNIRSLLNLTNRLECDAAVYYVDKLPALAVPSYLRTDLRFGWHVSEALEMSLAGQNIFDQRHIEFAVSQFDSGGPRIAVERSVFGKVTWRF